MLCFGFCTIERTRWQQKPVLSQISQVLTSELKIRRPVLDASFCPVLSQQWLDELHELVGLQTREETFPTRHSQCWGGRWKMFRFKNEVETSRQPPVRITGECHVKGGPGGFDSFCDTLSCSPLFTGCVGNPCRRACANVWILTLGGCVESGRLEETEGRRMASVRLQFEI